MIRTLKLSCGLLIGWTTLMPCAGISEAGPFGGGFIASIRAKNQSREYPTDYFAPGNYGYPLDDQSLGYYGGSRYREYYSFGRGAVGFADYPGVPPGPAWLFDNRNYAAPSRVNPFDPLPPALMRDEPVFFQTKTAQLLIHVPADAEVFVDGVPTRSPGPVRQLITPPLQPRQRYSYELRARWVKDGQPVDQTQNVMIQGGDRLRVHFPVEVQAVEAKEPAPLPAGLEE